MPESDMDSGLPLAAPVNGPAISSQNAAVAVYSLPAEADAALRQLKEGGFPAGGISVAAKNGASAGFCFCRAGAGAKCYGASGGFWNAVWEMLPGWAILCVPGEGGLLVAGRLAEWMAASVENAAIFRGLSAFGAALYNIGVSKEAVAEYEAALAGGKYVVIAHGPAGEVARARRLLAKRDSG
jgi:hypothetical protein